MYRPPLWLFHAKNPRKPFAGPEQVLDYIGRYTHRVAISNHRIIAVENGRGSFHYRDQKDKNSLKIITFDAFEFFRRFSLHGFTPKIHVYPVFWVPCKSLEKAKPEKIPYIAMPFYPTA